MNIRPAAQRGKASFGWLNSRHSFSFGHYYDPQFMGYGPLRVINDDRVIGNAGFPPHGHADMEIITYVVSGALEHKDSDGNHSIIRPGEVQRMSAGRGIRHSEYNASDTDEVRFLQIWIEPDKKGGPSGYQQKAFESIQQPGSALTLLISPNGSTGSITIQQQAWMYGGRLRDGVEVTHALQPGHIGWLQVVSGKLRVNAQALQEGDGAWFEPGESVHLDQPVQAQVLLFEMRV